MIQRGSRVRITKEGYEYNNFVGNVIGIETNKDKSLFVVEFYVAALGRQLIYKFQENELTDIPFRPCCISPTTA